jgi:glycine oxidase
LVGALALTTAALAAARALGAEVTVESGALDVGPMAGARVSVSTSSMSWDADYAVLAAGSWSSQIAVRGADEIPVRPIRGQLLQLNAPRGVLGRVVWGTAGYLVPWPDGAVLVGATVEDVGFDESSTELGQASLVAAAASLVPALRGAGVSAIRVGLRPRSPDDLPLIGRSKVVPGLVYATGHYRNGVLLAPLTARTVREIVLGTPSIGIASLDPARCGNL